MPSANTLGESELNTANMNSFLGVLEQRAGIQLHTGKTRVWNLAGVEPQGVRDIARSQDPDARVWVGDPQGAHGGDARGLGEGDARGR